MTWFNISALVAVVLSLYVMQKTEHDQINKVAPNWLRWLRRLGFIFMATALCDAIVDEASRFSLLMVYGSGVYSLAMNALALHLRAKPKTPYAEPTMAVLRRRRSY